MQTKAYWDFKIDNVDIIQQLPDSKNQAVFFDWRDWINKSDMNN